MASAQGVWAVVGPDESDVTRARAASAVGGSRRVR